MYKKIYRSMRLVALLTLVVTSILIMSAAYTTIDSELRRELRSETKTCAAMLENYGNASEAAKKNSDVFGDKRATLISENGEVLFDSYADKSNLGDHSSRPEVVQARKSGLGESERVSVTASKKYYYCAVLLSDGTVFRMASSAHDIFTVFMTSIAVVLVMAILIFVLTSFVAAHMTDNIVKPIERLTVNGSIVPGGAYPELMPMLERIASQHGEIRRQMAKVSAQKLQLQTITDNMNEGFAVLDRDGIFLSANKSALAFFGSTVRNAKYTDVAENPIISEAIGAALGGEYKTAVFEKDDITYRGIFSPVKRGNTTDGAIVLLLDITATAEAERMRREFSANVSHELKTPLTSIHGYSQLIAAGMGGDNTVLFAQKMLSAAAKERNVTLQTGGADCIVHANRRHVVELIYDLCDNAIKYNRDGGSVTVTVWENRLTVADTGIGIPQEDIDRIFERFYRVDKSHSRKLNGTGLGLSIVKHLARLNGIEISVSSRIGEGSRFTLTFSQS